MAASSMANKSESVSRRMRAPTRGAAQVDVQRQLLTIVYSIEKIAHRNERL